MSKVLFNILTVLGVLTIIYAILMATMSNFNVGIVIVLLIGIVLAFSKFIRTRLSQIKKRWVVNLIKIVFVAIVVVVIGIVSMLIYFGANETATFDEDAVIVLGAGIHGEKVSLTLKLRLDRAVEYWNENPDSIIVVTGGQGPQEDIPEALAMQRYLIANGIPEDVIVMEDKSTSTLENFENAKVILDDRFDDEYETAFITNSFHVYRAGKIATLAGLDSNSFPADTVWYTTPVVYAREVLVVLKSWVLGY